MKDFLIITSHSQAKQYLLASMLNQCAEIYCCDYSAKYPDLDPDSINIEQTMLQINMQNKAFTGVINFCSAFQLSRRILDERISIPLRRVNIVSDPKKVITTIYENWLEKFNNDSEAALKFVEKFLDDFDKINIHRRTPKNCLIQTINESIQSFLPLTLASQDKLFLSAIFYWCSLELLDLLTATQHFSYEKLLTDKNYYYLFLKYITRNKLNFSNHDLDSWWIKYQTQVAVENKLEQDWKDWQKKLLSELLKKNKVLNSHYKNFDYQAEEEFSNINSSQNNLAPLISIQLNSNRPAQLSLLFDNLEETADNPQCIEVLVNIDDGDFIMEEMLRHEQQIRTFSIKFITTPRPKSFCDLWQPLNRLLTITHPNAYFLLNISDEMYFKTPGWDRVLEKYVGFFPDDIFRLRASRNKYRNYFDLWECGFAQDSIPITTKKWVDIGGDWNPCFGPDSFQQFVAFYLANYDNFSHKQFYRDLPLQGIEFGGDIPFLGVDPQTVQKHIADHMKAWFISVSYPMQLEAARRAALLRAHIIASQTSLRDFIIKSVPKKKRIELIDQKNNRIETIINYKISWLRLNLINQYRKLYFSYYFGSGKETKRNVILTFGSYLINRHRSLRKYILKPGKKFLLRLTTSNIRASLKKYLNKVRSAVKQEKILTSNQESNMFKNFLTKWKNKDIFIFGEESRFFLLIKELSLFKKQIKFNPVLARMQADKNNFLVVKVPHIEDLASEIFIANSAHINFLEKHSSLKIIYDLSTEAITFSGFTSEVLKQFHAILKKHHIDAGRVFFFTANANGDESYRKWCEANAISNPINVIGYNFYLYEYWWEIKKSQWFNKNLKNLIENGRRPLNSKNKREKYFLCLNLRPRAHRTAIVLHLLQRDHLQKGYVTYFGDEFGYADTPSVEKASSVNSFIEKLPSGERLLPLFAKLQSMAPLQLDRNPNEMRNDLWQRGPGEVEFLIPEARDIQATGINTYFEIVTETWFTDDANLYITEKSIRAILRLQPFIHVGSPGVLRQLRMMGFKTFHPYIDESYDEIIDPTQRMEKIFLEIDRLCNKSLDEIHEMYCKLWPTVLHNFKFYCENMPQYAQTDLQKNVMEKISA